ncbi:MAG: polysaccharide pyruvyl transferase family protein [Bacteroidales bacterium]|nr:polysaccharide pyruvyl transferase family protein [Bacteroidales bacterium]
MWNTAHKHGRDPAFYLDFVLPGAIRASYAASFSIENINEDYRDFVKAALEKFDAISVREESGLRILSSLGIAGGIVVLDPVFLLKRSLWNNVSSTGSYKDKYILIYDQENNPLIKQAARILAKLHKVKIYAIQSLYPMYYASRVFFGCGPREFLDLIRNCEICLTNSFHATAFSLIFQKEFYTFERIHEKVNSRMVDLLNMLHLDDRIISDISNLGSISPIDYGEVSKILESRFQLSKEFIDNVLKMNK